MFEKVVLNEPSVFEPVEFYCNCENIDVMENVYSDLLVYIINC